MGKYEKKNTKKSREKYNKKRRQSINYLTCILVTVLVLLVVFFVLFNMPLLLYNRNHESEHDDFTESTVSQIQEEETRTSEAGETAATETGTALEFPVNLEDGEIQIESLFQFSGINIDAQLQDATDVASIVLINTSDRYLKEAAVTATLATGNEVRFLVTEVPAGADAMAFSLENEQLLTTDVCTGITVDAVFEEEPNYSGVEISVDGMMVTVTNTSSEDVENLDVYYHDIFTDRYFGGKTYIYNIEYLSAGESMTFAADQTILGIIEVVRVAVNNMN